MLMDYYAYAVEELGLVSSYTPYERSRIGKDFIRNEGKSRHWTQKILHTINSALTLTNLPQLSKYDIVFESGGTQTKVEGKVRKCCSYTYPDLRISAPKCDFSNCDDWWVSCYYEGDGKWYVWDLSDYTPRRETDYRHSKYTSECDNNYEVVEDCWVFDFSEAAYAGKRKEGYGR